MVWSQSVEALIAIGRLEEAEEVLAELSARATVSGHPSAKAVALRCEGQLRAARGELAPAIDAMDRGLAAHAQALVILEPLGAQIWASRARDELSRIGLRRAKAAEGLTPAQARVAELVAAGLSNPQIARQLHMSLRTVESHLSRVYREYGVTSRSQLAATLGASGGVGGTREAV